MATKQIRYGAYATSATQREIDHPAFRDCVENWRKRFQRLILVVDRNAVVPKIDGLRWYRVEHDRVMFKDVIRRAIETANSSDYGIAIGTPLLLINSGIHAIDDVVKQRQLGTSWVGTSMAITLDETRQAGAFEDDGLRFFITSANLWRSAVNNIPDNPPFVDPLWGAVAATHFTRRIQDFKYFDMTPLRAVGNCDQPRPVEIDMGGYGDLTFNPPTKTYFKEAVAE